MPRNNGSGAFSCYHARDMNGFGFSFEKRPAAPAGPELEDFADNPALYTLLARLPRELRDEHMSRIEHLADDEAEGYLYALHERRAGALRESSVSDESLKPYFDAHQEELWNALETDIFTNNDNLIRNGTTASVKRLDFKDIAAEGAPEDPIAVKYLISPNSKTLSASGEHDMIAEVEQIQAIERAELAAIGANARIRVPHPYFYYQKGKIQCYGMQLIDGINLEQGRSGEYSLEMKQDLAAAFATVDRKALMQEIDMFFDTMHTLCLHGDIKPRNLMVSRDGCLYVIDFGQSVLTSTIDEKSGPAFEELKDAEKQNTKDAMRFFLDSLQ